jgi:alkanesulfonate monooxygenase SsuD/methylene tetrahydromethanopterin reductase-like flavin-dependent oxidoreductase (luciferase family)
VVEGDAHGAKARLSALSRIGVLLPTFDPLRTGGPYPVAEAAREAEDLGFDGVWAGDHLLAPAPWLDAPTCLAAAAAATSTLTLGLSVMLVALRPLAWVAKQVVTLDRLSGGRLQLGVGVGGEYPEEFAAAGVPVKERGRRLDAALEALPDLLLGRAAGGVPALEPPVSALPPVLVGGRGDAALRRAARFGDAWLPMWLSPDALAERAGRLAELAAAQDRPTPRLVLLVLTHVDDDLDRAREAAAAHLASQYRLPLEVVERWAALGSADAVAQELSGYLAVGVQELILMPLGPDPLLQYERLAEVRSRLATPSPPPRTGVLP